MQATDHSKSDHRSVRTTIGGYGLAIAKALEHNGVDSTRIFQAAGIPASMLKNDPLCRLPVDTLTRLYKVCVDVTHNPYFGLTVSKFIQVSNLHALGYALAASSSLMAFCQRLERFFRLASQACEIEIIESGQEVSLRTRMFVSVCAETEDAFLGFVVLAMRAALQAGIQSRAGRAISFDATRRRQTLRSHFSRSGQIRAACPDARALKERSATAIGWRLRGIGTAESTTSPPTTLLGLTRATS